MSSFCQRQSFINVTSMKPTTSGTSDHSDKALQYILHIYQYTDHYQCSSWLLSHFVDRKSLTTKSFNCNFVISRVTLFMKFCLGKKQCHKQIMAQLCPIVNKALRLSVGRHMNNFNKIRLHISTVAMLLLNLFMTSTQGFKRFQQKSQFSNFLNPTKLQILLTVVNVQTSALSSIWVKTFYLAIGIVPVHGVDLGTTCIGSSRMVGQQSLTYITNITYAYNQCLGRMQVRVRCFH